MFLTYVFIWLVVVPVSQEGKMKKPIALVITALIALVLVTQVHYLCLLEFAQLRTVTNKEAELKYSCSSAT